MLGGPEKSRARTANLEHSDDLGGLASGTSPSTGIVVAQT